MKKVIIADDHPIFRAGLRQIVEEKSGYEVVAEASDGKACITSLELSNPDILILDLAMPGIDGYAVLSWLNKNMVNVISVVISMYSSRKFAVKAKNLGARAFIAKEDAANELHNALLTPRGVFYLSASVGGNAPRLNEPGKDTSSGKHDFSRLNLLTPSELKIFNLVSKSMTSREIGEALSLSYRTIQTHRQHINQKLRLHGPNSLIQYAIRYQENVQSAESE